MSLKEKWRHLFKVFFNSKGLFACFSIVLSLLLIIGSTYAWLTDDDQRINRTEANRKELSARIDEDFDQVFHWAPGTTKTKGVRVTNNGEVPAIVRLSLEESFLKFKTDVTDNHVGDRNKNGNLVKYPDPIAEANQVKLKDTSTWQVDNYYEVSANVFHKVEAVTLGSDYVFRDTTRQMPLEAIQLNFPAHIYNSSGAASGQTDYWYYEKGYFYYSEVLAPGESTSDLLESLTLNPAYTNEFKGAVYKLVPKMDAHDITRSLLSDWNIDSGDYAHSMYQSKLH